MPKIARRDCFPPPSHILVLEDDPNVAAALVSVLEDAGYRVTVAATVAEAGSILGRRKINLFVADIVLGDGTTFEILETVRRRAVPYLLITGSIELVARFKTSDELYLTKPVKIETLLREVRRRIGPVYGARQNRADG